MRESRTYGSVRGAHSDVRPYRDLRFVTLAHMWTAPCLQERGESVMRIACVHMCGFERPDGRRRVGVRDARSKQ